MIIEMLRAITIYNIGDGRQGESEWKKHKTSSTITETVASKGPLGVPVEMCMCMTPTIIKIKSKQIFTESNTYHGYATMSSSQCYAYQSSK